MENREELQKGRFDGYLQGYDEEVDKWAAISIQTAQRQKMWRKEKNTFYPQSIVRRTKNQSIDFCVVGGIGDERGNKERKMKEALLK